MLDRLASKPPCSLLAEPQLPLAPESPPAPPVPPPWPPVPPVPPMRHPEMDGSGIVLAGQTQVPLPTQTKGSVSGSWSTSARQQTLLGCVVGHALEPPPPPFRPWRPRPSPFRPCLP